MKNSSSKNVKYLFLGTLVASIVCVTGFRAKAEDSELKKSSLPKTTSENLKKDGKQSPVNLLANGNFEIIKDGKAAKWSLQSEDGTVSVIDSANSFTGKHSLHMKSKFATPGKNHLALSSSSLISPIPDNDYVVKFLAKSPFEHQQLRVYFYTSSKTQPHWYRSKEFMLSRQWSEYTMRVHIPDAEGWQKRKISLQFHILSGEVILDNIILFRDSSDSGKLSDSKSTESYEKEYQRLLGKNLLINGGAERGMYQVFHEPVNFGTPYSEFSDIEWRIFSPGYKSPNCFSFGNTIQYKLNNIAYFTPIKMRRGKSYFFSLYAKSDTPNAHMRLSIFKRSSHAYAKKIKLTKEWRRYDLIVHNCGNKKPVDKGLRCYGDMTEAGCEDDYFQGVPRLIGLTRGAKYFVDNFVAGYGTEVAEFETGKILLSNGRLNDVMEYKPSEKFSIPMKALNASSETLNVDLTYEVKDFFGESIHKGEIITKDLKANESFPFSLDHSIKEPGVYNITINASFNGQSERHVLRVNILKKPEKLMKSVSLDYQAPFGKFHYMNVKNYAKMFLRDYCRHFGIGAVRMWIRDSRESESDFEQADREAIEQMKEAKENDLSICFCWKTPKKHWDGKYRGTKFVVKTDLTEFRETLSKRFPIYMDYIDYFELMNEPNIWPGKHKGEIPPGHQEITSEFYANLLKSTHEIIEKIKPGTPILGPATANMDHGFIESVLSHGVAKLLFGISYHGYRFMEGNYDLKSNLEILKKILNENKGGHLVNQIFQTECGVQIDTITSEWKISSSQKKYAKRAIKSVIHSLAHGQKLFCLFRLSALQTAGYEYSALLVGGPSNENNFLGSPMLYAIRALNARIANSSFLKEIVLTTDLKCFVFRDDASNKISVALWAEDALGDKVELKYEGAEDWKLYDFMGRERKINDKTLRLGQYPIFIDSKMPVKEIEKTLLESELKGVGKPFEVTAKVVSDRQVNLIIKNKTRSPLSGQVKVKALSPGLLIEPATVSFKDLTLGSKIIPFSINKPIDMSGKKIAFETSFENSKLWDLQEVEFKAILCRKVSNGKIVIDASLDDWKGIPGFTLDIDNMDTRKEYPKNFDWKNFKAPVKCAWDNSYLYFAVKVEDEVHCQNEKYALSSWKGDSVQIAFDTLNTGMWGWDVDDALYVFALMGSGKAEAYCHKGTSLKFDAIPGKEKGPASDIRLAVKRDEKLKTTTYEMAFPLKRYSPFKLIEGNFMRICLLVNNNNGDGRLGWVETSRGVGASNSGPKDFLKFILINK